jgi:hypothetical protein
LQENRQHTYLIRLKKNSRISKQNVTKMIIKITRVLGQHICVVASLFCIFFATSCHAACGVIAGVTCNGGVCERGNCVCPPFLTGPDCKYTCPGPLASPCNGRGTCIFSNDIKSPSAICSCAEYFRGPACTVLCPTFSGSVCSGRGLCNQNGTCDCNSGFVGSDCSNECSGGSQMPCFGHGKCLSNRTCVCDDGYFGESCRLQCASSRGLLCSGRGVFCFMNI